MQLTVRQTAPDILVHDSVYQQFEKFGSSRQLEWETRVSIHLKRSMSSMNYWRTYKEKMQMRKHNSPETPVERHKRARTLASIQLQQRILNLRNSKFKRSKGGTSFTRSGSELNELIYSEISMPTNPQNSSQITSSWDQRQSSIIISPHYSKIVLKSCTVTIVEIIMQLCTIDRSFSYFLQLSLPSSFETNENLRTLCDEVFGTKHDHHKTGHIGKDLASPPNSVHWLMPPNQHSASPKC
jgi:hypothetical protein